MPKQILESDIEKATSEFNVSEDWQVFMDICDRIKTIPNGPKEGLKYIMKRVNHQIPHVALQALTLLSTCVSNCGKAFLLEVSSRDWCNNAKNVITRGHEKVSQRIRELIKKWAEEDFKDDPQLALMVQFYKRLKQDGFQFDFSSEGPSPALVSSLVQGTKSQPRNDDDLSFKEDLELAIAMSLQESDTNSGKKSSSGTSSSSLYPSFNQSSPSVQYQEETELFKVRALYDFEAAEDNEMTFKIGDVFSVLDNSDENWWKGKNHLGVGLFPATFVTTDLTVPQEKASEKRVRFADSNEDDNISQKQQYQQQNDQYEDLYAQPVKKIVKKKTVISEEHLDQTLSMLKNASPYEIDVEEETITSMEDTAKEMGTLIEKKILETERRKDDLSDLNEKFLQALQMYQQLMKEPINTPPPPQPMIAQGLPPQQQMYAHLGTRSPQHSYQYQQPPPQQSQEQNYQYPSYSTQAYSSLPTIPPSYQKSDPRLYDQQTQPHSLDYYSMKQQQQPQSSQPSQQIAGYPQQQSSQPSQQQVAGYPQQQYPTAQPPQQPATSTYHQQPVAAQPPQQPATSTYHQQPAAAQQPQQQQYNPNEQYYVTNQGQYANPQNTYMNYEMNTSQHAQMYQQTPVYQ